MEPTGEPTSEPAGELTGEPTSEPAGEPSGKPTGEITSEQTGMPTNEPLTAPTVEPSVEVISEPTVMPTFEPSAYPISEETNFPTLISSSPLILATPPPTYLPSKIPVDATTSSPTLCPTSLPSLIPTIQATVWSTQRPSVPPSHPPLSTSATPTMLFTMQPTLAHTHVPTQIPITTHSVAPTRSPTVAPSPKSTPASSAALTLSVMDQWRKYVQQVYGTISEANIKREYFADLVVENIRGLGSCGEWQNTIDTRMSTDLFSYTPKQLRLTLETTLVNDSPVYVVDRTCRNSVTATTLLQQLVRVSSTGKEGEMSYECNGVLWRVGRCEIGQAPFICADCTSSPCAGPSASSVVIYMSPCSTPEIYTRLIMLQINYEELTVTPVIKNISWEASKHRIAVTVGVSDVSGSLVCAAYMKSKSLVPSDAQILALGGLISINDRSPVYTINNLMPATEYDIYCATFSSLGFALRSDLMQATHVTASTLCCRTIVVQIMQSSYSSGEDTGKAVSVSIGDTLPEDLSLTLLAIDSGGNSAQLFFPSQIRFTTILPQSVAYIKHSPDTYTLAFTMSGSSSAYYEILYSSGNKLTVLSATSQPSTPRLVSAVFANDGTSVTVAFDSPTDKARLGNNFFCNKLLSFPGMLQNTRCLWTSDTSFAVFPAGITSISVGSIIHVHGNMLKARCRLLQNGGPPCDSWNFVTAASIEIAAPSNPVAPTISIIGPTQVGPCDRLPLDVSGSRGNGGRPFATVLFTVEGIHSDTATFAAYLNAYYSIDRMFEVPQTFLIAGYAYNIIVTMCNFLGGCGRSSLFVAVSTYSSVPVVSINSKQLMIVNRFSSFVVSGQAHISSCNGTKSPAGLTYEWTLVQSAGPVAAVSTTLVSVSPNPRTFRLNPFVLAVGATYRLTLTARHQQSLKYSSSFITMHVSKGAIVAVLSGGSERGIPLDGSVEIDASGSYDEDNVLSTAPSPSLLFAFTCIQTSPDYKIPSGLAVTAISGFPAKVIITVPGGGAPVDSVHLLTVTVTHRDDLRVSTKTVTLRVLPPNSPVIRLESASGLRLPSEKLKLLASIKTSFPVTARWSVNDPSISLGDVALSETERNFGSAGFTAPQSFVLSLVLPANTLPQQSTYSFSLTCTTLNGHSATALIAISTNAPPLPGQYIVSPETGGVMLRTDFTFTALQWEDADIPVTFEFAYQSVSGSYLVHRSRAQLSFTSALLPAGRDIMDYALSTRLVVFDVFDAQHTEYQDVQVYTAVMSAEDKMEYMEDAIGASYDIPEEVKRVVATVSLIVNAVNCSQAPDCDSLNRHECSAKAGMCGLCKTNFIGESGHANSHCVSQLGARRKLKQLSLLSVDATTCSVDDDCLLPRWHVCTNGKCAERSKECPNDCSGVGSCEFVSVYDAGLHYPNCSVLNSHCKQTCVCPSGRGGLSCEMTITDYQIGLATRQRLVEAIRNISLREDTTRDTVSSWIDSLAAICTDSTGIADETKVLIAGLTLDFLKKARDLKMSYEMIASVSIILDLVLDVNVTVDDSNLVFDLLQEYNAFIADDIVAGQYSVQIIHDLFRSSFYVVDSQSSKTIASPVSAFDNIAGGAHAQRVVLPQRGPDSVFKVTLTESLSTIGNFVSVPLGIRFDDQPCSSLEESNACVIIVVLQIVRDNKPNQIDSEWESIIQTLECSSDDMHSENFACPGGLTTTLSCNGLAGKLEQPCPRSVYETYCSFISKDGSACRTLNHSSTEVTCACSLSTPSRRLQGSTNQSTSDSAAISIDIVAAGQSTLKEFASTWTSTTDLTSRSVVRSIEVLITVGGFAAMGIAALCIASRLDYLEEKVHASGSNKLSTKKKFEPQSARVIRAISSFNSVLPSPSENELEELHAAKDALKLRSAALFVEDKHGRKNFGKKKSNSRIVCGNITESNSMIMAEEMKIDESLPMVLRPLPIWKKFMNEMQMHHRWVGVVCHYSRTYSRPIRMLSLLMNILIMLFVQSVTYNIADPDDGTCEKLTDREDCLVSKSIISSSESKCYWNYDSNTCHFRPFEDTIERVIIVALFAAVVSAPFAVLTQSLIMFVLAAETERSSLHSHRTSINVQVGATNAHIRAERNTCNETFVSVESSQTFESVGKAFSARLNQTSVFVDFNELLSRIQVFRLTLPIEERKEFDRVWGFSEFVPFDNDGVAINPGVHFSRILSRCGRARTDHRERILLELSAVQRTTENETLHFSHLDDDKDKSKRLLFLFIKDLMDGVNGDIVDIKDRMDNSLKRRVSMWSKCAAWAFLFMASISMLFYIYLFAMKQSASRQHSWFISFIVWLIFEILLASSGLVMLNHVMIPLIVMGDLRRVKKQVVRDIIEFKNLTRMGQSSAQSPIEDASNFNAAKYFFPSYRLAMMLPSLPESKAILHYSTPYPKNALGKKAKSVKNSYDFRFNFIAMSFSRILIFALTRIITLPDPVRNMVMDLVACSGLGYVIIIHMRLYKIHPILVVLPSVAAIVIAHGITMNSRKNIRLDAVSSSDEKHADNPDIKPSDGKSCISDADVPSCKSNVVSVHPSRGPDPQPMMNCGIKSRRQTIAEGVALVQRLATNIELRGEPSSGSDDDESVIEECAECSSHNRDLFELPESSGGDTSDAHVVASVVPNSSDGCGELDDMSDESDISGQRRLDSDSSNDTESDIVFHKPRLADVDFDVDMKSSLIISPMSSQEQCGEANDKNWGRNHSAHHDSEHSGDNDSSSDNDGEWSSDDEDLSAIDDITFRNPQQR